MFCKGYIKAMDALIESAKSNVNAVHDVLLRTEPEQFLNIAESGVSLTGWWGS